MGLGFYLAAHPEQRLEAVGEHPTGSPVGPVTFTLDGRYGGSIDKCIYVRNDNPTRYYDTITVSLVDPIGVTNNGRAGWEWKLLQRETRPPQLLWDTIAPANTLSLSAIGSSSQSDINIYIPIWVHVKVPRSQRAQNLIEVQLYLSAKEYLVV